MVTRRNARHRHPFAAAALAAALVAGIVAVAPAAAIDDADRDYIPDAEDTVANSGAIVSTGRTATQSSVWAGAPDGSADAAVDGMRLDGRDGTQPTAITDDDEPWWEVDLWADHVIGGINVHNRTDGNQGLLSGAEVLIGRHAFGDVSLDDARAAATWSVVISDAGNVAQIDVPDVDGRFVRIQLPEDGSRHLGLSEVDVFAVDTPSRALSLDGSGGITLPEPIIVTDDFTVETWVWFTAGTTINNIDGIMRSNATPQDMNFWAQRARFWDATGGWDRVTSTVPVTNAQWVHVAFTRENGVLSIYQDGVLSARNPGSHTNPLRIDELGASNKGYLDGMLADTRVWSVARSAAEITESANALVDPNHPDLILSYQYRASDGAQIENVASPDFHGTSGAGAQIVEPAVEPELETPDMPDDVGVLSVQEQGSVVLDESLALGGDFTIESRIRLEDWTSITQADGLVRSQANRQDINFFAGQVRLWDANGGWDRVIAADRTTAGGWTHVAIVRSDGALSVYLDGELSATGGAPYTNTFVVDEIGAANAGSLWGQLEETRIWSVARTASEISDAMSGTVDPASNGLALYYRYDGADPMAITNLADDRYHGSAVGGPFVVTG